MIRFICMLVFVFSLVFAAFGQESMQTKEDTCVPLKIIVQPKPSYTDAARKRNVEGWVRLKVTFGEDATVKKVELIAESSKKKKKLTKYGLVTQAIESAKQIIFEPELCNGKPILVTKTVEYRFSLY
jgi:Gram-negative bacterial TonB protein C-terminal